MAEAHRNPAAPVKVRVVVRARAFTQQEVDRFKKTHLERFLTEMGLEDFIHTFKAHENFSDPSTWEAAFSEDVSNLKKAFPMMNEQDCVMFMDFINSQDLEMRMDPDRADEELTRVFPDEDTNMISVQHKKESFRFEFDKILGPQTSQPKLFHFVGVRVCDNALRGGKGCVVAFGNTGSGKSFSIEGIRPLQPVKNQGVVIQSIDYILKQAESLDFIRSANVSIQAVEIFTNMARDLIEAFGNDGDEEFKQISIQENVDENAVGGAHFCPNIVEFKGAQSRELSSIQEAIEVLDVISENRMKADWNLKSGCSRSHCMYKISVETEQPSGEKLKGSVLIIDCAGSEIMGEEYTDNLTERQVEALNVSLTSVCEVIEGLRNPEDFPLIPFQNHILSSAMKDHVQRGSDVHLLLCCNPDIYNTEQSLKTLNFGASARGLAKSESKVEEGVLKPVKLFRRTTAEDQRDDFGAKWSPPPMFRA